MIGDDIDKRLVIDNRDTLILAGISLGNLARAVRAAIVDNDIFPIVVALAQNALDAGCQVFFSVVDRRDNADEWLLTGHSILVILLPD